MRDGYLVRLATAVVLLLGSLIDSESGLAHGAAHLREAHHEAAHEIDRAAHHHDDAPGDHAPDHEGDAAEGTAAGRAAGRPELGAPDHHRGHDHSTIDEGRCARADDLSFLRADAATVPPARELTVGAERVVAHDTLARADPATGPPPRLRAPPSA